MFVYRLRNRINGKVYIGKWQGPRVEDRWREHELATKSQQYVHTAIRSYGWDNFDKAVLYQSSDPMAISRMETFFIVLHQSHLAENGYNQTMGGETMVGPTTGRIWVTDGALNQLTFPQDVPEGFYSGRTLSPAHLSAIRAAAPAGGLKRVGNTVNKGRKQAPEVIAQRAASNLGKKRNAVQLANLKAGWLACKEKKSKTVKALWNSTEFRDKQKLAHQDLPRDTQGRYLVKAVGA